MSEQFILFSKDRPVINFSSRKADGYVIADMRVSSEFPHLMPFELRRSISPASLESWLARRISMIGKKTLACIAQAKNLDKDDLLRFVKLTHALSLNDAFWIRDAESSLAWKDANLYHNDFSDELGMIGLSGSDGKEIALAAVHARRSDGEVLVEAVGQDAPFAR